MSLVRHVLEKKGRNVVMIDVRATALDAAKKMHEHRIGGLIVMRGDQIAGIFTERDLLNRVVALGRDPARTPIEEVMTAKVAVCKPETTVAECRSAMTKHKMRHLPVIEDGRLVGIISSGDILARELADQEETIRYLHEYMHGPR